MNSKIGYTGIFILGTAGAQSRHSNDARNARHFGAKGPRKVSNILLYPGSRHMAGKSRKNPAAVIKWFAKNTLRRSLSVVLNLFSRLPEFFAVRQDLDSEPIRVHPLKKDATLDASTASNEGNPFVKSGKSDADVMLEMKRNPLTSVYEVKQIFAAAM